MIAFWKVFGASQIFFQSPVGCGFFLVGCRFVQKPIRVSVCLTSYLKQQARLGREFEIKAILLHFAGHRYIIILKIALFARQKDER